jgi:uncharacterized damage-inducible protein DinB
MLERPGHDEYDDYYALYVNQVPDGEILKVMDRELEQTLEVIRDVAEDQETFRYEPGKWSIREVVGHMADVERVFGHRALWFSHGAPGPLPGMDADDWAAASNDHDQPVIEMAMELAMARASNRAMFAGFDDDMLMLHGEASGCKFSVRSIAWILVGHEMHHRRILRERYLVGAR